MQASDDDLERFEAEGAAPLPAANEEGYVDSAGARIWYSAFGAGAPVVLLHGGLGCGANWGYQVPALVASGYRAIAIDSRGHGRSTRDERPFRYALMAEDVVAVVEHLALERASFVGWSDGAIIALTVAMRYPQWVERVFAFGVNMDLTAVEDVSSSDPLIARVITRARLDYERLSQTPQDFAPFSNAVFAMMGREPNYTADDLRTLRVPIAIVRGEDDALLKAQHADYLAATIPKARFVLLRGVGHFALLQRPDAFNEAMLGFLHGA